MNDDLIPIEADWDAVRELGFKISKMLDEHNRATAFEALLYALGLELSAVDCAHCRKLARQGLKRRLRAVMTAAENAVRERNTAPSAHTH